MYSHIVSSALDDWVDELTGDALIDYALVRRSEMLMPVATKVSLRSPP